VSDHCGPRELILTLLLPAALTVPLFSTTIGCQRDDANPRPSPPAVPHGFVSTLQVVKDEHLYRFGPFMGYYFRPVQQGDYSRLEFVCFNEQGFYASDMPIGAKLFTGEALLTRLETIEGSMPDGEGRIQPVFFDDAPPAWTSNRPEPQDEFLHFHSSYDAAGATFLGYWIRHRGVDRFTYDMGGRVDRTSPLWHRVGPGPDHDFPRIIEFDSGPKSRTATEAG